MWIGSSSAYEDSRDFREPVLVPLQSLAHAFTAFGFAYRLGSFLCTLNPLRDVWCDNALDLRRFRATREEIKIVVAHTLVNKVFENLEGRWDGYVDCVYRLHILVGLEPASDSTCIEMQEHRAVLPAIEADSNCVCARPNTDR